MPALKDVTFQFAPIKAGSFVMGTPGDEKGRDYDENQIPVTLTRDFEMMTTEVTQKQWLAVMGGKNPSYFKNPKHCDNHEFVGQTSMCPEHPVDRVSWDDAQKFIAKLNRMEGRTGCGAASSAREYYSMPKGCYRLPTEAEWEHAVRAGTEWEYSFGDNAAHAGKYSWYLKNAKGQTQKVGKLEKNGNNLYDMHGNVWEWVQDTYFAELPGGTDPLQTAAADRSAVRGGGWDISDRSLRSGNRYNVYSDYGSYYVGFRLARSLGP